MPHVKMTDGVDIYYEATGRGTPFLFLSETACDGAVWNLIKRLSFPAITAWSRSTIAARVCRESRRRNTAPTCSPPTQRLCWII